MGFSKCDPSVARIVCRDLRFRVVSAVVWLTKLDWFADDQRDECGTRCAHSVARQLCAFQRLGCALAAGPV